jgi:8-oxo-dGTP diphosphatase
MNQVKPGLRVVSGALLSSDRQRVLMGLRKPGGKRPSMWELPGGKLEVGESPEDALAREWLEELNLVVEPTQHIASAFLDMEVSFFIDLYIVEAVDGHPPAQALDHVDLRWVEPLDAVQHLPCSPAFYLHWPHLRRWISTP